MRQIFAFQISWAQMRILLLFMFGLLLPRLGFTQPEYAQFPTYPAVVDSFFQHYSVSATPYSTKFEKRTTGWYVSIWYGDSLIQQMPYWSLDERHFRKIEPVNNARGNEAVLTKEAYTSGWQASYYRFYPYYGYMDWYLDVISRFGGNYDLPDSILYGMARAYSTACLGRLRGGEFTSPAYTWGLPMGPNSMTTAQLTEYIRLADLSLSYYDTLVARDPLFKTHVGEARLKRANEYVWQAQQVQMFQNDSAAMPFLQGVDYDPFYVALAKNFLASCKENAILFVNGDTDTFPLLYLQMKDGYRTDVTVVNMSMFNLPRYIEYLRDQGTATISLELTDSIYADPLTDFATLRNTPEPVLRVDTFLSDVSALKLSKDMYWRPALDLPSSHFEMAGPQSGSMISWTIPKNYILRNGIATLDLLHSNNWKRPIYFAITTGPDALLGLQDHFALEGLAYRLTGTIAKEDTFQYGTVDDDRCISLFTTGFDWAGMNGSTEGKQMLCTNYRIQMSTVAKHLCRTGRFKDAGQLLDLCMHVIPDTIYPLTTMGIPIMEAYYDCMEPDKGDAAAIAVIRSTLAIDLSTRDWGTLPEQKPQDLKEQVLKRVLNRLKKEKRRAASKEVRRMAKAAGIGA